MGVFISPPVNLYLHVFKVPLCIAMRVNNSHGIFNPLGLLSLEDILFIVFSFFINMLVGRC